MSIMPFIFCVAIFAALCLYLESKEKWLPAVCCKALASLCFVLLGVVTKKACGDTAFANLVFTGLILGMIADILLGLRNVFPKVGTPIFLVGILVFLAGHVMYLCALIPRCRGLAVCILAGVVLTALLLKWIFSKITAKKAFKIFGVFYIGAVTLMTCCAFGALLGNPGLPAGLFALGAVAFLVSDVVLILNTFGGKMVFKLRITNLSMYYVGQILIALSLLAR